MNAIELYDGDKLIHTITGPGGYMPSGEDVIRTARFKNVRPNTTAHFYDAIDGNTNDDFCIVIVKKSHADYLLSTFERSFEDEYMQVSYARNNGLDGKISRVRVQ